MALCELAAGEETASQDARTQYGFAFLDAAAGHYYVGCAADDAGRGNIGAILAQVRPRRGLRSQGLFLLVHAKAHKALQTALSSLAMTLHPTGAALPLPRYPGVLQLRGLGHCARPCI